jgi:hypothetical protein
LLPLGCLCLRGARVTSRIPFEFDDEAEPDHWSESGGRMRFHALGSFAAFEQPERRLPPLRSVLSFAEIMRALRAYALAYPLALPLAFLCTWLAGRLALGHWPRPSLDDPKSIGFLVDVPYTITGALLMFGLPVFAVANLALIWRGSRDAAQRRSLSAVYGVSLIAMVAVVALIRWDPWGIIAWYRKGSDPSI